MINLEEHDFNMINTRPIATESVKLTILTTYGDCENDIVFESIRLFGELHHYGNSFFFCFEKTIFIYSKVDKTKKAQTFLKLVFFF
jgi:hypothetical protein